MSPIRVQASHRSSETPAGSRWRVVWTESELLQVVTFAHAGDDDACKSRCANNALNEVRKQRPVAVLLSGEGQFLQLHFPSHGRVVRHWRDARGRFNFAITGAPLVFRLASSQTDAVKVVADAVRTHGCIVVVDPFLDGRPVLIESWKTIQVDSDCAETFQLDLRDVSVLTRSKANDLYQKVFKQDSVRPYEDGIPFRLSSSYCHVKAQVIVNILEHTGVTAGKVWVFAKRKRVLSIKTTSRKSCRERWDYHVAVIVRSPGQTGGGLWVFDPTISLAHGVMSVTEWKRGFGDAVGAFRLTSADAYRRECEEHECDCFERGDADELEEELKIARCNLACLSEKEGDPPHCCFDR